MSLTITVAQSDSGGTVTFSALAGGTVGAYAMAFDPGDSRRDLKRFRVPGMKGSYVIDGNEVGRMPKMRVWYVDTQNNVMSAYTIDSNSFDSEPQDITCSGVTFYGCHLESSKILREWGTGGYHIIEVEYIFSEDDPA